MELVFFEPRVGKNYPSGGIFRKRILVLGESHYCDQLCPDCGMPRRKEEGGNFTSEAMQRYLCRIDGHEGWMNTFTKFERSLINDYTDDERRRETWDSVLFYNYLQVAMTTSRQAGSIDDYERAATSFFEIPETYRPEYILVWGHRLWNYLPGEECWAWNDDLKVGDESFKNGFYLLPDGTRIKTLPIRHPSAGYSWDFWHTVIDAFINS